MVRGIILFFALFIFVGAKNDSNSVGDTAKEKTYTTSEFYDKVVEEVTKKIRKMQSKPMAKFSEELLKKEESLRVKEFQLSITRKELNASELSLERKINEFKKEQMKILGCLGNIKKDENDRINHLVEIISGMRPAAAAQILSVQDPGIAVKIVSVLPAEKSAKIFNLMDKEISARIQKQYMSMKK